MGKGDLIQEERTDEDEKYEEEDVKWMRRKKKKNGEVDRTARGLSITLV